MQGQTDKPYVRTFEDELDWTLFEQLHRVVLQISGFCFRTKQICLTVQIAVVGLLIKFTDQSLDQSIFVAGAVIPSAFWFLDSVAYFYQSKMRGLMKNLQEGLAKRNGNVVLAPGSLAIPKERAAESFKSQLTHAVLNHSMWLYPCLLTADAILYYGFRHGWFVK